MSRFPSDKRIHKEFDSGYSADEVIAALSWELAVRQRDHDELQDLGWMDVVESVRLFQENNLDEQG